MYLHVGQPTILQYLIPTVGLSMQKWISCNDVAMATIFSEWLGRIQAERRLPQQEQQQQQVDNRLS